MFLIGLDYFLLRKETKNLKKINKIIDKLPKYFKNLEIYTHDLFVIQKKLQNIETVEHSYNRDFLIEIIDCAIRFNSLKSK